LAFVPPPEPLQFHVQGPVPETDDAVPEEHRLAVGADVKLCPLADPHAPFTTAVDVVNVTAQSEVTAPVVKVLPDNNPPQVLLPDAI